MKLHRIAMAAAVLLGASGATLAQSSANIFQSGSNDTASIEQVTSEPVGSPGTELEFAL